MTSTLTLTEKRVARLAELTLTSGAVLRDVPVGYETYGRFTGHNAVLICHFFSGTSHAAGRYTPEDPLPGWWDPVIGPGRAIDTDRFYVVAIDALGCVRRDRPHGVTASAAGGPGFPVITIADMVAAQRQVLDQLGVGKLVAVAGPSLGAMQALEWALSRPQDVPAVIAAIAPLALQVRERGLYAAMCDAIRQDPAFNAGRYEPGTHLPGLATAVKLMTLAAGGRALPGAPPLDHTDAFEVWLESEARVRSSFVDANAWLAMLQANMRWRPGSVDELADRLQARLLLIPGEADALLPPEDYHAPLFDALVARGKDVQAHFLPAEHGHLAGLAHIGAASEAIAAFLA
ncbi:MAG: homoserine acetyltransferase [Cyanobacteria bacterium RYN_339]|nr:homoserine acetyltransferase [Cyanobacteria bacterium RYN_339]